MTHLDNLIDHLTERGWERTTTDLGYIRMEPCTAYSLTTVWLGPNGEMRSGPYIIGSESMDRDVNWRAVLEYEGTRAGTSHERR